MAGCVAMSSKARSSSSAIGADPESRFSFHHAAASRIAAAADAVTTMGRGLTPDGAG